MVYKRTEKIIIFFCSIIGVVILIRNIQANEVDHLCMLPYESSSTECSLTEAATNNVNQ